MAINEEGTTPEQGNGEFSGNVTIKWRDELKTFDLSDPDQRQELINKAQMGEGYQKGQEEIKAMKGQLDNWNNMLAAAAHDDDAKDKLVGMLEGYIGRPLTKAEEDDLMDTAESGTKKEIKELRENYNKLQQTLYRQAMDNEHSRLKSVYDDYNKSEVERYADENGIASFEHAYIVMNKEKLLEKAKKEAQEKGKKQMEKINKVASPEPESGDLNVKPKKTSNYDEIRQRILKEQRETGKSFFIQE